MNELTNYIILVLNALISLTSIGFIASTMRQSDKRAGDIDYELKIQSDQIDSMRHTNDLFFNAVEKDVKDIRSQVGVRKTRERNKNGQYKSDPKKIFKLKIK
jgi:hypothetical protein